MKRIKRLVNYIVAVIFVGWAVGCESTKTIDPLGGGYVEVTYIRSFISEPQAHQITLQYKNAKGRTVMIWPSVRGPVFENGLVIFVGDKSREPQDPQDLQATVPRLFAVQAPEPPLDITEEVLRQWERVSGDKSENVVKWARIVNFDKRNDGLELHFERGTRPGLDIALNWGQIAEVMREVKENGASFKDRVFGTIYIEK